MKLKNKKARLDLKTKCVLTVLVLAMIVGLSSIALAAAEDDSKTDNDGFAFLDPFTLSASIPQSTKSSPPINRPPIRIPFRPVLRSPCRPPLVY